MLSPDKAVVSKNDGIRYIFFVFFWEKHGQVSICIGYKDIILRCLSCKLFQNL